MAIRRYKLVRGALDFGGVANRATARSRYGGSFPYFTASVVRLIDRQEPKIIVYSGRQFCVQITISFPRGESILCSR